MVEVARVWDDEFTVTEAALLAATEAAMVVDCLSKRFI